MAFEKVDILRSFLFFEEKSFLVRSNGEQVSAEEIEGKIVGIYFSSSKVQSSIEFTEKLKGIYNDLREQGEIFEIVSVICHEGSEEYFKQTAESLPWLSLPFEDERGDKLTHHFLKSFPMLAVFGKNGEIIRSDVSDLIEEHGIDAYPFSPEKLTAFEERERARLEAQTLESLLVDEEHDFVIRKDGSKVSVFELVGKTVLFYYSSNEFPPCQRLKPKLVKAYHDIKAKIDSEVEIIFISGDKDQSSFDESYSTMPWLALSFDDQRNKSLPRKLKLRVMPAVVAIGPNGQTITNKAKDFLMAFGADAYPFTEEHLKELVEGWPKTVSHELHQEHELELSDRFNYMCDACGNDGSAWSFCCKICDFDLDPKCALGNDEDDGDQKTDSSSNNAGSRDRLICNGQVCYRWFKV